MIKGKNILITFLGRIYKTLHKFLLISIILETPCFIIKYTSQEKLTDNIEIKQKEAKHCEDQILLTRGYHMSRILVEKKFCHEEGKFVMCGERCVDENKR